MIISIGLLIVVPHDEEFVVENEKSLLKGCIHETLFISHTGLATEPESSITM